MKGRKNAKHETVRIVVSDGIDSDGGYGRDAGGIDGGTAYAALRGVSLGSRG
jgi:hypothetical protein